MSASSRLWGLARDALLGSQLRRNVVSGAAGTALNAAIVALSYPVFLHYLGFERYGVWLAISTVNTFAQLGNLGISQAVTRQVAASCARGRNDEIVGYVSSAVFGLCLIGVVVVAVALVFQGDIVRALAVPPVYAAGARALIVPVAVLSVYILVVQVYSGVLVGLDRLDLANTTQVASRVVGLGLSWAGLAGGMGLTSLLLGSFASYGVQHALTLLAISRGASIRAFRWRAVGWRHFRDLATFGLGVFASTLINMLLHPLNRVLVAHFIGIGAVPLLEIAYVGTMQMRAVAEAGLRALMTEFTKVTVQGNWARARGLLGKAHALCGATGACLFGGVAAVTPFALAVWLRSNYRPELVPVFRIMLLNAYVSLMAVPSYYCLMGLKRAGAIVISQAVQVLVSSALIVGRGVATRSLSLPWMAWSIGLGFLASTAYLVLHARALVLRGSQDGRATAA